MTALPHSPGMKRRSRPRRALPSRLSLQDLFNQRIGPRIGIQQPIRLVGTESRHVPLKDTQLQ
jgi:hypothetical protein